MLLRGVQPGDSPDRVIEVYTEPTESTFAKVHRYERGQSLRLGQFPDVEVRVVDVMK